MLPINAKRTAFTVLVSFLFLGTSLTHAADDELDVMTMSSDRSGGLRGASKMDNVFNKQQEQHGVRSLEDENDDNECDNQCECDHECNEWFTERQEESSVGCSSFCIYKYSLYQWNRGEYENCSIECQSNPTCSQITNMGDCCSDICNL